MAIANWIKTKMKEARAKTRKKEKLNGKKERKREKRQKKSRTSRTNSYSNALSLKKNEESKKIN